jgi:hypothetical protein
VRAAAEDADVAARLPEEWYDEAAERARAAGDEDL